MISFSQSLDRGSWRGRAAYAPTPTEDAHAVRGSIHVPIEREIALGAAADDDEAFGTRKSVVDDLGQRGEILARLVAVALPSALLGRYGDAGRAGELVTQADPAHSRFMLTTVKVLAQ